MVERVKVKCKEPTGGGNYFASPKTNLQFIPTGCKVLDLSIGGGWAERRVANIVGDKSTGKSLLCMEAAANFVLKYPKGIVKYREAESAFDPEYAGALGAPIKQIEFGDQMNTIEELFDDLRKSVKSSRPTLYIVDSLDALSDAAEMERDMTEGSYGTEKARKLSQLFRRLVRDMANANHTIIIVSQVRSKIGVAFGRNTTRSGGRALDFYASQVVYLQHIGRLKKTINGISRPVGIELRAQCDKNKVSLPFREAGFSIQFGFGIDDLTSCVEWLEEVKALDLIDVPKNGIKEFISKTNKLGHEEYFRVLTRVHAAVERKWYLIESAFVPKRSKYQRPTKE